ncbi:NAD(P)-dependent oxidoreductase [Pseudonocardia acaciae]|uniref:NAD(P)-dependent oxidoreductase n=1 Tax=Pseudonocardia acaciae TaxID=551276 RepID=UPI0004907D74|nr:NAD(P)-dependent oxidoreductase [Pseudonocardia acaciae]
MRVGFVGLGRMGAPMAANLARAGYDVIGYDTVATEVAGVRPAADLDELADTDLTISMLPNAEVTAGVLRRIVPGTGADHIHVAMGTLGVAGAADAAGIMHGAGRRFADAPVSGSVALAGDAQISTMVGATDEVYRAIRPALAAMTKAQAHVGPPGAGSALKLAVNIVIGANNQAIAEALVFAEAHGIDPATAYDVLETSAVASPYLGYKRAEFLAPGANPPTATVSVIDKDLALALDAGARSSVFLPGAAAVRQVLVAAGAAGLIEADMARVIEVLRRFSGR